MAKILIVEDDKALQEVYSDTLRAEVYEIDTADDGEIALQKMQQGGWDLVLLDIILPKINGIDIMERLKNQPPLPNPNKCVVFLTNLDKSEEIYKESNHPWGFSTGGKFLFVFCSCEPARVLISVGCCLMSLLFRGRVNEKVAPLPSPSDCAHILPPCNSTRDL